MVRHKVLVAALVFGVGVAAALLLPSAPSPSSPPAPSAPTDDLVLREEPIPPPPKPAPPARSADPPVGTLTETFDPTRLAPLVPLGDGSARPPGFGSDFPELPGLDAAWAPDAPRPAAPSTDPGPSFRTAGMTFPGATPPAAEPGASPEPNLAPVGPRVTPLGIDDSPPNSSPPTAAAPTPAPALSVVRHRLVDGDTLPELAARYLGSPDRFIDLFEQNRDILTTPDLLPIGRTLTIRLDARSPDVQSPDAPEAAPVSLEAERPKLRELPPRRAGESQSLAPPATNWKPLAPPTPSGP